MSTATPMPARGDRNAPQFDSTKPHELRRYFTDLEFLLNRAAVTDETEKKKHATRFLSVEDQEIWEALKSFGDNTKTFAQFKADVLKLYAGNDEDRRFELSDLDSLVGQYSRVGILTLDDLKTFYRQFLHITTYLLEKKHLSESEQSRSFLRAMQPPSLTAEIRLHLKIKNPNLHPADPRPVADLYEAAEYALADLVVSMESSAIRSILPIIDNQQQIESIVDGGSQIVAMAETICHELGLSYDPRIILRMQSANGSVSPSLGLARNVPFRIADIILYLQVHIVRNPAYDVLLGRPSMFSPKA
ncbi:hypothetical protein B0H12DRAFT_1206370 [Mycena haematopus]|nr:hypothetical protein B0H12DRAFT_1206370 [Mycena haematopus]